MWAFAFFLGGLGVAGQPQVVSRVMTLGSDSDRKQAMIWFFVWQTPFIGLMLIIGLASRVLFTASDFDPEFGLPQMAMETMPAFGIGMILASIFAATMSTADSQVLACTAAITDDIKPEWRERSPYYENSDVSCCYYLRRGFRLEASTYLVEILYSCWLFLPFMD